MLKRTKDMLFYKVIIIIQTKILRLRFLYILFIFFLNTGVQSSLIKAWCVYDPHHQKIVKHHEGNTQVFPASLTKIMTLYLLLEAIHAGKFTEKSTFVASQEACKKPPCKLGLAVGKRYPVDLCIMALSCRSANDVAHMIAQNIGNGSVAQFVSNMNVTAKKLGMQNTVFCNPTGLHDVQQRSTAHDMAVLIHALQRDFPQYMHYLKKPSFTYNNRLYKNTNKILNQIPGVSMIGKTGFTNPAGYNLATHSTRNGVSVAVVVMAHPTSACRFQKAKTLITDFYGISPTLAPSSVAHKTIRQAQKIHRIIAKKRIIPKKSHKKPRIKKRGVKL